MRDMQKKIMNLLEMTNASLQLMKDMTGMCVCVCVCGCVCVYPSII